MDSFMAKLRIKKNIAKSEWDVKPFWPERQQLAEKLSIPEIIIQLLYNRGITDPKEVQKFLQPSLSDLVEPARLIGVEKAVKRIRKAIAGDERIMIYGDYDVDGITGVSILWHCLKLAGKEVEYYVPHRIDEGYGLNEEAIKQLASEGVDVMITVDCGISAVHEAQVAKECGIDLIITDHHQMADQLPEAFAIVHPGLEGQDYPNQNLCGAAVAFKLAWAIAQEFSGHQKVSPEFRQFLVNATSLVALGTIADVVPLIGENRVLTRFGLSGLAHSENVGVAALVQACGLDGEKIDSTDIGFKLAPRLNAAGRMGHARLAIDLFTKSNPLKAREIATYLESQNKLRQKVEKDITNQAVEQFKSLGMDNGEHYGLVLAGENWHGGVIGIVASRIVDKYHCPTFVISIEDGVAKGSGRSIPGFNLYQALQHCSEHLIEFGGHHMAAGIKIDVSKIDAFRATFNEYVKDSILEEKLVRTIHIDAEATIRQLDIKMVEMIDRLAPFGQGNPHVLLVAKDLKLASPPKTMGKKGDHLQMMVASKSDENPQLGPGRMIRAVGFGKAKWEKKLVDAESFDLVFEPKINRFNGNTSVEIIAEDIIFH